MLSDDASAIIAEHGARAAAAFAIAEKRKRKLREKFASPGGLIAFMQYFWDVLEPDTPFLKGWALEAICLHLEAVTSGKITRLLINVPPGACKSLTCNVFYPAWEWSAKKRPGLRYLSMSFSSINPERDNRKFRDLMLSKKFQDLYGDDFALDKSGEELVSNNRTGSKFAVGILGTVTGQRGDRILCLPGSEPILTDKGWLPIGDVVERRMAVKVAGLSEATNTIIWQDIEKYERNPGRDIVEVSWGGGSLRCTPDHPIFVKGRGYIQAQEINAGDVVRSIAEDLRGVRNDLPMQALAFRKAQVLRQGMPVQGGLSDIPRTEQQAVRGLWDACVSAARALGADASAGCAFLQPSLLREVEQRAKQHSVGRGQGHKDLQVLRQGVRVQEGRSDTSQPELLLKFMRNQTSVAGRKGQRPALGGKALRVVQEVVRAAQQQIEILLSGMREYRTFSSHVGEREWPVRSRRSGERLSAGMDKDVQGQDQGARRQLLPVVWKPTGAEQSLGCASHRLRQRESGPEQSHNALPVLSRQAAWSQSDAGAVDEKTVISVKAHGREDVVYNVRVAPCHNYFASGILVHNCDDPNSVKDEKDTVRKETARFFREGISNRLNHLTKSAIIVVQQRVHEEDVSGVILSDEMPYVHLFIPLLSEEGRRCVTPIWSDPRKREGLCFWPERYPPEAVEEARAMGDFAFAGQYQMRPEPRGGGLFKRDYWQPYSPRNGKWPSCDYIVASLDPAFTAKESNDPAGFTIWGSFETEDHDRAVILLYAWRKWCVLHGPTHERWPHETTADFKARTMADWGLVEHVADALMRFKVDKLLIENKASGIDVNTEMVRLYGDICSYELIDPKGLDKWARAVRIQPVFSEGQVYAPWVYDPGDPDDEGDWRKWAALVIDEMASFPTGKFDDVTDSATMAIWWLRQHGFLTRRAEKAADLLRAAKDYKVPGSLYPV